MDPQRKVDVSTGASQGIGAGLVRSFLDRGYRGAMPREGQRSAMDDRRPPAKLSACASVDA